MNWSWASPNNPRSWKRSSTRADSDGSTPTVWLRAAEPEPGGSCGASAAGPARASVPRGRSRRGTRRARCRPPPAGSPRRPPRIAPIASRASPGVALIVVSSRPGAPAWRTECSRGVTIVGSATRRRPRRSPRPFAARRARPLGRPGHLELVDRAHDRRVVRVGHHRADLVAVARQGQDPDVVGAEHDPVGALRDGAGDRVDVILHAALGGRHPVPALREARGAGETAEGRADAHAPAVVVQRPHRRERPAVQSLVEHEGAHSCTSLPAPGLDLRVGFRRARVGGRRRHRGPARTPQEGGCRLDL